MTRRACHASYSANRVLGILKNAFSSKNIIPWKKSYTTFMVYDLSHLEIAVLVSSPYNKNDIKTLKKMQKRAKKLSRREEKQL